MDPMSLGALPTRVSKSNYNLLRGLAMQSYQYCRTDTAYLAGAGIRWEMFYYSSNSTWPCNGIV